VYGSEMTGGGRKWIVFGQIDREAEKLLQLLFGDDDEIAQTERIQCAALAEENAAGRLVDSALRGQLHIKVRDRFVNHVEYIREFSSAVRRRWPCGQICQSSLFHD
jgi:hypothetical protein